MPPEGTPGAHIRGRVAEVPSQNPRKFAAVSAARGVRARYYLDITPEHRERREIMAIAAGRVVRSDATSRPKKRDKGHSVVRSVHTTDRYGLTPRLTLYCQCGKKFSGTGSRAFYSHENHVKKEIGS